ncbi:MAG TPA: hypothetical protein VGO83_10660 [Thermoleophilaceae bacterium]|jgi:hypothetical protein|nr:hypothetical protein [Thermoleophilaceae bacterium]
MTDHQLHRLLTDANPVSAERAARLEVAEAQHDLLAGLMRQSRVLAPTRRRPRASGRRVWTRVVPAIAATAVVLVAVLSLTEDSTDHGSGTAWAAEQVRFAEASPLVLIGASGWRVEYANEESQDEGELHFRRGPAPPPPDFTDAAQGSPRPLPADTGAADLNWRGGPLGHWLEDRAASAVRTIAAPVLGTTAHVYQYEGGTPGHREITALFRYDGRVLEFRAGAADLDAFKALLASLERVDVDSWLSAMPASVIKTADREATIEQMLKGVETPPGFHPKDITGAGLTSDRYQLGAAVTGTVACQWFRRWADARRTSDRAKERAAIAAMAGAKRWPILQEMAKQGGYPDVMLELAAAMPSGEWFGRPLIGDVDSALGCQSRGVDLR